MDLADKQPAWELLKSQLKETSYQFLIKELDNSFDENNLKKRTLPLILTGTSYKTKERKEIFFKKSCEIERLYLSAQNITLVILKKLQRVNLHRNNFKSIVLKL